MQIESKKNVASSQAVASRSWFDSMLTKLVEKRDQNNVLVGLFLHFVTRTKHLCFDPIVVLLLMHKINNIVLVKNNHHRCQNFETFST